MKDALKKTSKSGDGEKRIWSLAENHNPTPPLNLLPSSYRNIAVYCHVIGWISCTVKNSKFRWYRGNMRFRPDCMGRKRFFIA